MRTRENPSDFWMAVGACLVLFLGGLVMSFLAGWRYEAGLHKFDPVRWKSFSPGSWSNGRYLMVGDLILHNQISGRREGEILALLGAPDPGYTYASGNTLAWQISAGPLDTVWLVLESREGVIDKFQVLWL